MPLKKKKNAAKEPNRERHREHPNIDGAVLSQKSTQLVRGDGERHSRTPEIHFSSKSVKRYLNDVGLLCAHIITIPVAVHEIFC